MTNACIYFKLWDFAINLGDWKVLVFNTNFQLSELLFVTLYLFLRIQHSIHFALCSVNNTDSICCITMETETDRIILEQMLVKMSTNKKQIKSRADCWVIIQWSFSYLFFVFCTDWNTGFLLNTYLLLQLPALKLFLKLIISIYLWLNWLDSISNKMIKQRHKKRGCEKSRLAWLLILSWLVRKLEKVCAWVSVVQCQLSCLPI